MKTFSVLGSLVAIPEELSSWALLERSAANSAISVGAGLSNSDVKWRRFFTNDLDCFGTGPYNDLTPTETNTSFDGLLVIKKTGIYIVDYYVGWDDIGSSYEKSISVYGGYANTTSLLVNIDRRDSPDFRGVVTEGIRDSSLYPYQHTRRVLCVTTEVHDTQKAYIGFTLTNSTGTSKNAFAQFAGIVRIPSNINSSVIFS